MTLFVKTLAAISASAALAHLVKKGKPLLVLVK
jgi:hypothetical protein